MAGHLSDLSATERVRTSCHRVAETAELVTIDSGRLDALAARLADDTFDLPTLDLDTHYVDDVDSGGEHTLAFFLTLEAVNFGSGSFPDLRHTSELSGYFTVAGALARRFRDRGPFTAAELIDLEPDACAALFGQIDQPSARPLMAAFAEALGELGQHLETRFGGSFAALVEAADRSAERLVDLLITMPGFRDEASHSDRPIYLYKRAQLTAADLSLAFGNRGAGRFDDLDRLTIFADDLVPHVLRTEGVLIYAPELATQVDAGERLTAGSTAEVEIRACAIHASEQLVAALRRRGASVDARRLDYRLWNLGLGADYRAGLPHRSVSRFY